MLFDSILNHCGIATQLKAAQIEGLRHQDMILHEQQVAACPAKAETRCKREVGSGANTMMPPAPQLPPRGTRASQRSMGVPPSAATRSSWPCAKKPRKRLSGDQKGQEAPSVLGRAVAFSASRD